MKSSSAHLVLLIILAGSTSSSALSANCSLECKPLGDSKRADKVEVKSCKNDKAVVEITRQFGIGGTNLIFHGEQLPKKLELRFKKFDNLESFGLICGQKRINTSLKMSAKSHESVEIPIGNNFKESAKTQAELNIHMKIKKDQINVDIPCQTFMGANRELSVSWVDWYRH